MDHITSVRWTAVLAGILFFGIMLQSCGTTTGRKCFDWSPRIQIGVNPGSAGNIPIYAPRVCRSWETEEDYQARLKMERGGEKKSSEKTSHLTTKPRNKPSLEKEMFAAIDQGDVEKVKDILGKGWGVNMQHHENGNTALHYAAFREKPDAVKLLIQNGANPNIKNRSGLVPLHFAAWNDNTQIIAMLRDSGATINLKTKSGSTPLHYAANNYSGNSARMLLKAGAGPNARNNSRECPLHIAAKDGNFGTVKALLIGGADVNAADSGGKTPLKLARTHARSFFMKRTKTIALLEKYGGKE